MGPIFKTLSWQFPHFSVGAGRERSLWGKGGPMDFFDKMKDGVKCVYGAGNAPGVKFCPAFGNKVG